jgi:septal ring factor EnvC (AmiA/AmiB activator)
MRLPEGWREGAMDTWIHDDARADIFDADDRRFFVSIEGPNRATKEEAEADLERMVWALERGDPRARVVELETWNAAMSREVEKATTRADLSDKALDHARKEIADLRAEINRMEARELRRHPVLRKIAHALYVLRGPE